MKPSQLLFTLLLLAPFAFLLMLALGRGWTYPQLWPAEWTLEHLTALSTTESDLGQSLLLSLFLSLTVAALATGLGFVTSRTVTYHRRRWLTAAYFPYVFAPVILAACLQFYFVAAGLSGRPAGVLFAQLLIAFPFGVIFFSNFWTEQIRAMEQLAATLGGAPGQVYRHVLLPVARGPLLVCFFQTFLISWFEYGLTMLIGVGKVQTLTVKVFYYVNEANIYYAALAGLLLVVPPVVLLWLNKRFVFVVR